MADIGRKGRVVTAKSAGSAAGMRGNGFATGGCLVILIGSIVILGIVVSWLWYRAWHDGEVGGERREKARASIVQQARASADDTVHALDASGTTDVDALTEVVWRHTDAPVITYDLARHTFTATAAKSAHYDEPSVVPGGGPVEVTRCFVFTYRRQPGHTWTSQMSERHDDVCRPGTEIDARVTSARTRMSNMDPGHQSVTGIQKTLDPTGRQGSYAVERVVEAKTVTAFILVSSSDETVAQCYRFTRPTGDDGQGYAAVPTSACEAPPATRTSRG